MTENTPEPAEVETPAATEGDLDATAEHDTATAAAEPASDDDPRDPRRDESDYVDEAPAPDVGELADDTSDE